MEILYGKKSQVSEQNFTEGKAHHYLCSVVQCVKLCFMMKNFEKKRSNGIELLKFSIEKVFKNMENDF